MRTFAYATAILASVSSVAGHAIFQDLWDAGKDLEETCVRFPVSNSPVTNVQSTDIRCNAKPAAAPGKCAIKGKLSLSSMMPTGPVVVSNIHGNNSRRRGSSGNAPATSRQEMHQQPHDRKCTNEAIGGNHYGPVMIYMSKVSDSTTADGSTDWFKIAETGYDPTTKKWGTDVLNDNCGKYNFTVPAAIAPGDYLLRAEAIALHTASQANGAQFYMSCDALYPTYSKLPFPAPVPVFPQASSCPVLTTQTTLASRSISGARTSSLTPSQARLIWWHWKQNHQYRCRERSEIFVPRHPVMYHQDIHLATVITASFLLVRIGFASWNFLGIHDETGDIAMQVNTLLTRGYKVQKAKKYDTKRINNIRLTIVWMRKTGGLWSLDR